MSAAAAAAASALPFLSPCPLFRSWAVLNTAGGALAGRFTDELEPTDAVQSNETYWLSDNFGNSSFSFGVPNDLVWWPGAQVTLPVLPPC